MSYDYAQGIGTVGYGGYGGSAYGSLMNRLNAGYGMASHRAYGAYGDGTAGHSHPPWLSIASTGDPKGKLACISQGARDPEATASGWSTWCPSTGSGGGHNSTNPVSIVQRVLVSPDYRYSGSSLNACTAKAAIEKAGLTPGVWNAAMTSKVKAWQRANSLDDDGIMGPNGWKKLIPQFSSHSNWGDESYESCSRRSRRSSGSSSSGSSSSSSSSSGSSGGSRGADPFYKKTWFLVTAGVVVLGGIGAIAFWPKK